MKSFSWDDLKIFLEVGRAGSFSGGARVLRLDVSTVSRRISQLEQIVGALLFEREVSGLKITQIGTQLLERSQSMEAEVTAFGEAVAGTRAPHMPSGVVRIGMMEGIASFYICRILPAFRHLYPHISVELISSANSLHVSRREADVFLSFYAPEGRGLHVAPAGEFKLFLYGTESYLQRSPPITCADDLNQHEFISYVDDLVQLEAVRWLNDIIKQPKVVFTSTSMIAQMNYAAAGGGLVMLPAFMEAQRFGLVPILPDLLCTSRLIWITVHQDLQYIQRIKLMTGFLLKNLAQSYPLTSVLGGKSITGEIPDI